MAITHCAHLSDRGNGIWSAVIMVCNLWIRNDIQCAPSVKYEVHNVVCRKELDGVSVKYMP